MADTAANCCRITLGSRRGRSARGRGRSECSSGSSQAQSPEPRDDRIPDVNITVVGAGIVGSAIAHELASRGARVQLIDSRGVGRGATRASAGILAPQIEGHIPELRKLAVRSLALYDDF